MKSKISDLITDIAAGMVQTRYLTRAIARYP